MGSPALNDAIMRHGDPIMADYTPTTGDVPTGGVIVTTAAAGNLACVIAHHSIPNNTQGAVAIGGGVYDVVNKDNAANFVKVYWDNVTSKVTTTATTNALFGYIVANGGGGANSVCRALHFPYM